MGPQYLHKWHSRGLFSEHLSHWCVCWFRKYHGVFLATFTALRAIACSMRASLGRFCGSVAGSAAHHQFSILFWSIQGSSANTSAFISSAIAVRLLAHSGSPSTIAFAIWFCG